MWKTKKKKKKKKKKKESSRLSFFLAVVVYVLTYDYRVYILQKNLLREARASPLFFVVQSNSALGSPPSSLLSNKPLKRSNLHQKIDPGFKLLTLFVSSPSWY